MRTGDPALVAVLERARALGFLGPGPVASHVAHADGFVHAWGAPPPALLVDLGSGGGVPGLVLARRWAATTVLLLDANERRTAFLAAAAAELGLAERVVVRRDRAEDAGRDAAWRATADLVTARGFGPPAVAAECGAPFLRVGGRLIVSEPPDEVARWPAAPLGEIGLLPLRRVRSTGTYLALVQAAPCPDRVPRRSGVPAKRPLF